MYVMYCDGGARGNPGVSGYGAVVVDEGQGIILQELYGYLGITTNNVAEYSGLIAGLSAAKELGIVDLQVKSDSNLVVNQMSGKWKIKNADIRELASKAKVLEKNFTTITYEWIPREENKLADSLANKAMDAKQSVPPFDFLSIKDVVQPVKENTLWDTENPLNINFKLQIKLVENSAEFSLNTNSTFNLFKSINWPQVVDTKVDYSLVKKKFLHNCMTFLSQQDSASQASISLELPKKVGSLLFHILMFENMHWIENFEFPIDRVLTLKYQSKQFVLVL